MLEIVPREPEGKVQQPARRLSDQEGQISSIFILKWSKIYANLIILTETVNMKAGSEIANAFGDGF